MMRVLIYGAGQTGEQILNNIKHEHDVIGFLDGNPQKKNQIVGGCKVLGGIECLQEIVFDRIYIGTTFWNEVESNLIEHGVPKEKIVIDIPEDLDSPIRRKWLEGYAELSSKKKAAVAEAGVYRGDFASVINRCFPDSKLYLFDTFEGFDERDVEVERSRGFSNPGKECFSNTSVEMVMAKMSNPSNVEIRRGYFPLTTDGIEDEFIFVNLDFDLYNPILEGLRFFYPRMIRGAVLLVHDYYHAGLPGVKLAIEQYEKERGDLMTKMPIGDGQSIALIKM